MLIIIAFILFGIGYLALTYAEDYVLFAVYPYRQYAPIFAIVGIGFLLGGLYELGKGTGKPSTANSSST